MPPKKRPPTPQEKADKLLRRFPLTDLARAIGVSGAQRRKVLELFVKGRPKASFAPLRNATRTIFNAQPLLSELVLPAQSWEEIEPHLKQACRPGDVDRNLEVGRMLFDHARSGGYEATEFEPVVFRYGPGTVTIALDFYLTKGEELIFQFPHFRADALLGNECTALASIINQAYAVGDYEAAQIEIASFSVPVGQKRGPRETTILTFEKTELLARDDLNREIADVYAILRILAEQP